jgi:flagellar motor component MotA
MFSIIGIVVVFGAIVAGYLMEHGNMRVLVQPAELIIILGAAIGTVLIANPLHILTKMGGGVAGVFGGSPFDKQRYYHVLRVMLVALLKGTAPTVAIEIGRRAIPSHVRPTFQEAEAYVKDKGGAAAPPAAAAA